MTSHYSQHPQSKSLYPNLAPGDLELQLQNTSLVLSNHTDDAHTDDGHTCHTSMLDDKSPGLRPNKDQSESSSMTFDLGVLEGQLGDPGRLQMIVYLLLATVDFSVSCNMVVGVFFVYTPRFSCHAHLDVNQQSNITGREMIGQQGRWDVRALVKDFRIGPKLDQIGP